jgi:hypothetical protein
MFSRHLYKINANNIVHRRKGQNYCNFSKYNFVKFCLCNIIKLYLTSGFRLKHGRNGKNPNFTEPKTRKSSKRFRTSRSFGSSFKDHKTKVMRLKLDYEL